jgi:hypothetical protein
MINDTLQKNRSFNKIAHSASFDACDSALYHNINKKTVRTTYFWNM